MAMKIPTEGNVSAVHPANGDYFTLAELQNLVGYWKSHNEWKTGFIEPIFLSPEYILLVNEDGLPLHLPPNKNAYVLTGRKIVGNAALLTSEEWNAFNAPEEEEEETTWDRPLAEHEREYNDAHAAPSVPAQLAGDQ